MTPYVEDRDVQLYLGDALVVLGLVPDGSCDAVVTSPPYLNARPEYPSPNPEGFTLIFNELRRVCTGTMLLNVGRLWRDRVELRWWNELIDRAADEGWPHRDTVIWVKQNGNPFQGEIVTNSHEYVFLFGDGFDEDAVRTEYDEESLARMQRPFVKHAGVKNDVNVVDRTAMETRDVNEKGARGKSFFICPTGKEKGNEHPAPMPLELAEYMVRLACPGTKQYCPTCGVDCVDAASPSANRPVSGMRGEVLGETANRKEVLLPQVHGQGSFEDVSAQDHNDEGLRGDPSAGTSTGVTGWVRDGASAADGEGAREDPREPRSRPPSERDQERQPYREPRTDDEEPARSKGEAASEAAALSELRRTALSEGQARSHCQRCGSLLAERPTVILDPFAGSGTTLLAARRLDREAVGIELSEEYAAMAAARLAQQTLPL